MKEIDKIVKEGLNKVYPGAVLLVGNLDGEVLYKKSYGFRALKPSIEKNSEDTVYDLASLTKVVATTTSIMLLLSEKMISLWDYVSNYINGFERGITIFHLLTHTSGLPPYSDVWKHSKDRENILNSILKEKPVYKPGSRIVYSCLNFIILMIIVEKITKKNFKEFCDENIFKPFKLNKTSFLPSYKRIIAPTTERDGKILRGEPDDELAYYIGGVSGNAGLFSDAQDLFKFIVTLWKGKIIPRKVFEEFISTEVKKEGNRRFLGWDASLPDKSCGDRVSVKAFGHDGFTGTSLWVDPEKEIVVIFLTNRTHIERRKTIKDMKQIRISLHNAIFSHFQ